MTALHYKGFVFGNAGVCDVEFFHDPKIVIVTEVDHNTGPSITNAIEFVGRAILDQRGIDTREEWTLIEHYEAAMHRGPTWDLVTFAADWKPSWKQLGEDGMNELLLDFPWLRV